MSEMRWNYVSNEEWKGPEEHELEHEFDGCTQSISVGTRPYAVGGDWGVSVVPVRHTGGFSGGPIASRLPSTTTYPRWTAVMGAIQVTVQCVSQTNHLHLVVPDLNVVNLVAKWQRGEKKGEDLVGKNGGVMGAKSLPGLSDEQLQADLLQLYLLCNPRGNKLVVEKNVPFARLNIESGVAAAKARVRAVSDSFVFFYPSHMHTDCFEVRFFDQTTGAARFERFFWWGEAEVSRYINLAAEMGDAERLDAARLALEDPLIFWCICFRFKSLSRTLLRHAPGWEPLREPLRQARARAAAGVTRKIDGGFVDGYKWDSMVDEIAANGGRGSQFSIDLAERGYVQAIHHTMHWTDGRCDLSYEMDENDSSEFMKSLQTSLFDHLPSWKGCSADERGTDKAIEAEETQMLEKLKVHDRVQIMGLKAKPELNGCRGVVVGKDVKARRAQVKIDDASSTAGTTDETIIKVKAKNLYLSPDLPPPPPCSQTASGAKEQVSSCEEEQPSPSRFNGHVGGLFGQLRLCACCGRKEQFPKQFRACSKCHTPRYCSKDCQLEDWKSQGSTPHRQLTSPFPFSHKTICSKVLPASYAWAILLPADRTLRPFPIILRAAGSFDGSDHPIRQDLGGRHVTTRVSEVNVNRAIDYLALYVFGMREEGCSDFSQIRVEEVKRLPSHIHSNVFVVHRYKQTTSGTAAAGNDSAYLCICTDVYEYVQTQKYTHECTQHISDI